jgi:hypothetical protein
VNLFIHRFVFKLFKEELLFSATAILESYKLATPPSLKIAEVISVEFYIRDSAMHHRYS